MAGQLVALQALGGGQLLLQFGGGDPLAKERFPFQLGRQAAGDDFQQVRLPGGEIAFLAAKDPERAQDRGGRGDRHADGGGEIFRHLPMPQHLGVFQHDGMAQQGLQVGHGALQGPGRVGEAFRRQSPARPQFQFAGGVVEQVECGRLAVDGLGAAAEHGLQAGGQVAGLLGMGHQGDAGGQLGLALPEGVPRLEQFAHHAGQGGGQRAGVLRRSNTVGRHWRSQWHAGGGGLGARLRVATGPLRCAGRRPRRCGTRRIEWFEPEVSESSSDARVDRGRPTQARLLSCRRFRGGAVDVAERPAGGGGKRAQHLGQTADGAERRWGRLGGLFGVEFQCRRLGLGHSHDGMGQRGVLLNPARGLEQFPALRRCNPLSVQDVLVPPLRGLMRSRWAGRIVTTGMYRRLFRRPTSYAAVASSVNGTV